jgi:hypothetical protein
VTDAAAPWPHVRLPAVAVPPGDPTALRQRGGLLTGAGQALGLVAWRLRADGEAISVTQRWCGVASARYEGAVARQGDQLATAGRVLLLAGAACVQYAQSLDLAQARARDAAGRAEHLVRECDDLAAAWGRYDAARIQAVAVLPSPVQAGELVAGAGLAAAELRRLETWATVIRTTADQVAEQAQTAAQEAQVAAARACTVFDTLASGTTAARAVAARRQHDALVAAGVLPAEDGSAGSRLAGALDALRADVTEPVGLLRGLLGADGPVGDSWSRLGHGVGRAVTHPGDLLGTVVDWKDVRQGDWGHWVGTVLPGTLMTAGSGGAYGIARGIRSADLLAASTRVADELRRATELLDAHDWAQTYLSLGGRLSSRLAPGGGLIWHEAAGGHLLDRHVGLAPADLRRRIAKYRLRAASAFADRSAAEQLVAEAMERQAVHIAEWLGTDRPELEFLTEMRRAVGTTVRRGSRFVEEGMRVKVVLIREPASPVGYILLTAFPLP